MPKSSTQALASALLMLLCNVSGAEEPPAKKVTLKIDAPLLYRALIQFTEQAGLQLIFPAADKVSDLPARPLAGTYTPQAALDRLLENSGLRYEFINSRTVAIHTTKSGEKPAPQQTGIEFEQLSTGLALHVAQIEADDRQVETSTKDAGRRDKSAKTRQKSDGVEEMIVEDSKIKPFSDANADLPRTMDDPQPYYIFDSKEIERSGALTVQDFLRRRLTMDTTYETNSEMLSTGDSQLKNGNPLGDSATSEGIPGSTVSSFNLRGLGTNKTLILINGRRLAGVNYSRSGTMDERQPDLNGISLSAVDRIEVLPSSASAIYGGGAIGGVINVVLKRSFQGGDLRVSYNAPSHSDASTSMATATYGLSFEGGKSQLMASASFSVSKPMVLGERAQFVDTGLRYLRGAWASLVGFIPDSPYDNVDTAFAHNLGTSMGPTGTFVFWRGNTNLVLKDGTVALTPTSAGFRAGYVVPGVTSATPLAQRWHAFTPDDFVTLGNGYGRFGKLQPLGTESEVKTVNASFTRQMTNHLEAFLDFQLNESHGQNPYQPQIFIRYQSTDPQSIFQNNIVDFRTTIPTPKILESTSLTRTWTAGVKGHFGGWMSEFSFTRSENTFDHGYGVPDTSRLSADAIRGLTDVLIDPFAVDLNLDRYTLPQPFASIARSDSLSMRLAGPVFRLPWGEPILSIGLERHKPSRPSGSGTVSWTFDGAPALGFTPRVASVTTHLANSTANYAAYVEGRIPLITEKNAIPLIRSFDLQLAQRVSRSLAETGTTSMTVFYNAAGAVTSTSYNPTPVGGIPISRAVSYSSSNGTFAFKYEPVEGVALRASIGTAFVPPTYAQLVPDQRFTPALPNGPTITNDPLTGLTYRTNSISGGNPDLKPQTSESKDIGLIYQPRSELLKGLRVNLQYYSIGQFDFISSPSITELLTLPELANRVIRDPVSRQVTQVDLSLMNVAERSSSGLDLTFDYQKLTSWGDWSFSLGGTKIIYERRQLSASSSMVDYAGYPGSGGPVRYKAYANVVWGMGHTTLGWTTNWYGNYRLVGSPGSPGGFQNSSGAPWALQGSYSVPAQMYHHMFASYDFGKDAKHRVLSGFGVQLNIENVFNKVPPFDVTYAPFYLSPLGSYRLRTYTLAIKKSF